MTHVTPEPGHQESPGQEVSISTARKMLLYELRVLDEMEEPGTLAPPVMAAMLQLDNAVYELVTVLSES